MANGHVWPEVDKRKLHVTFAQRRLLYRNRGNARFHDVSRQSGPGIEQVRASRGCAFGDFDNDGDLDVVINPVNDSPVLLRADSTTILDGVAETLRKRPELNVEIGGHTDNRGAEAYNQSLSEQRARAVQDYLVARGVDHQDPPRRALGDLDRAVVEARMMAPTAAAAVRAASSTGGVGWASFRPRPRKVPGETAMADDYVWITWSASFLVPWAALLTVVGLGLIAAGLPLLRWALLAVVATVVATMTLTWWWPAGRRVPRALAIPSYVLFGLVAGLHAWIKALTGDLNPVWEPTRREPISQSR